MEFSYPGIAQDIACLRDLLLKAMVLVGATPRVCPAILNLACGRADETGALIDAWSVAGHGGEYLGLDLRHAEIHEAQRRWSACWQPHGSVEFRVADVSQPHRLPGDRRYDFAFVRHQNYWDAPAIWDQIYRNALARLKPDGLLVFTSYFDREHELAMAALKSMGATLWLDIPHTRSRILADAPGKSVDKRLAILGPPEVTSPIRNLSLS
jgi:SAM-dependent methyltransferase